MSVKYTCTHTYIHPCPHASAARLAFTSTKCTFRNFVHVFFGVIRLANFRLAIYIKRGSVTVRISHYQTLK